MTQAAAIYRRSDFYPRSPCGERRQQFHRRLLAQEISIHALLAESDNINHHHHHQRYKFLSTLSLRRATNDSIHAHTSTIISIHALLAESDQAISVSNSNLIVISIHALLAESDRGSAWFLQLAIKFLSTLSLRRATERKVLIADVYIFLSTLSLRRATSFNAAQPAAQRNFYPRSPCGERPVARQQCGADQAISIHALLAESDERLQRLAVAQWTFLSTLSLRRATAERYGFRPY